MDQAMTRTTGSMWNPEAETLPRAERAALQGERLRRQVERAYERVPFYRESLERQGIGPQDIRTLDDIVRLQASSGTTGKIVIGGYTRDN